MKRIVNRLALAGLVTVAACSGGTTITSNQPSESINLTGTLQGIVADAVTGKRVGGDLKLYLIQGSTVRGPSRLITGATDPLMGEYAFTGVPVTLQASDATWKVVAIASNYERFESEFTFTANPTGESGFPQNYIDTVFNKIGNIFLFPIGTVAPDYAFNVFYNGKPVANATVELDPDVAANQAKFTTTGSSDQLFANTGYVPSITGTTDANGHVVIAGSGLVLGGHYAVSVLPLTFTDSGGSKVPLALTAGNPIVVGFASGSANNDTNQTINMSDLVNTGTTSGVPLFLASVSNPAPNEQLFADGKLTVVFNAAVSLINPNCFDAALTVGAKADLSGPGTGVLSTTQPVNAALSSDGLTLTLAPNFSTAPTGFPSATTDRGVAVTYAVGPPGGSTTCGGQGGAVVPKDYPALSVNIFTLHTQESATVLSGLVHISGP